ncbi:MAG: acetyl-CoA carboxylase biotin carboxyl carrier protein [Candidatus Omnitrophica bacterium]|nr:acetyl-CoA carboxylase biotin carboxyl carrier protein [Candidatus Omnitrophota bacterium]MCM8770969.1 acetyl-CoA carboxylase biotin carboxyl carrier protein [Candidatus Omnitrophota bacterium]
MNLKEIKEMINLMNEHGLMELEIEKDGMRIKLKKASSEQPAISGPIIVEKEKIQEVRPKEEIRQIETAAPKTIEIKAPMVGTFYRAPSPESPPYVEKGQIISAGDVICIIEAMKLMNEIKSEIKGKIVDILVDNAEPVEFGQPIFLVEVM